MTYRIVITIQNLFKIKKTRKPPEFRKKSDLTLKITNLITEIRVFLGFNSFVDLFPCWAVILQIFYHK